jgi:hypothetical protein
MKYNFETWEYEKDIPEEPGLYILFINRPIKKLGDIKNNIIIGDCKRSDTIIKWCHGYKII